MKKIFEISILISISQLCVANNFCYIGDSQSASKGALFDKIKSTLREYGDIKNGMAVCGASIQSYLDKFQSGCKYKEVTQLSINESGATYIAGSGKTENLNKICQNSDTVIIQLGDNNLKDPKQAGTSAKKLVSQITNLNKKCVWIGPASIGGRSCSQKRSMKKKVSEAIELALKSTNCTFINSFNETNGIMPKSKDKMCIHYPGQYGKWAKAIDNSLRNTLENNGDSTEIQDQLK